MSPDSKFTRQMAGLEYVVGASSKGARLVKSKLVVVRYTSGSFSHWCQIASCVPRHQWVLYIGILHHTLVAFARQHFWITTTTKKLTLHFTMFGLSLGTQYWPGIHINTMPTGSFMQKIKFVWPDLLQLPSNDIYVLSINATTNLPKYTLNKIVHTIHRQNINPANHPASQADRIWIIKWYLIPGCNNLFPRCIYRIHCHIAKQHGRSVLPN